MSGRTRNTNTRRNHVGSLRTGEKAPRDVLLCNLSGRPWLLPGSDSSIGYASLIRNVCHVGRLTNRFIPDAKLRYPNDERKQVRILSHGALKNDNFLTRRQAGGAGDFFQLHIAL